MPRLTDIIPLDDLHWDSSSKSFQVLSETQVANIVEACYRIGMIDSYEIRKVIKEYEQVKCGNLFFKHFINGNLAIYEFHKGIPQFEPVKNEQEVILKFTSFSNEEEAKCFGFYKELNQRFVNFGDVEYNDILETLYETILNFAKRWNINILSGENIENNELAFQNIQFATELQRRNWSILELNKLPGKVIIVVRLKGSWFRTKYLERKSK